MELGKNYLLLTKVWSLLPKPARKGILGGVVPDPISDQTSKIHTRFPTLAEIMSSLLRVERKQKISSNAFRIHIFLFIRSYSFGIEKTSMFIHSRSSLEKLYPIPDQNGEVYTRNQTMYSIAREKQSSYVLI